MAITWRRVNGKGWVEQPTVHLPCLTQLTALTLNEVLFTDLPASLVTVDMCINKNADLVDLTRLQTLRVTVKQPAFLFAPTHLRVLRVKGGSIEHTNIADLALHKLECSRDFVGDLLDRLPTTLQTIAIVEKDRSLTRIDAHASSP